MPTYTYKCECKKEKEAVHKMSERPVVECECGREMGKVIRSATKPVLKGAWFKEGY